MKRAAFRPILPAIFLPFLALTASAQQTTGVSHPDDSATAPGADHYVKPSQALVAPTPAYQDSYPATASEPRLLVHDPASPVPVAGEVAGAQGGLSVPYTPPPVERAAITPGYPGPEDMDGQIVMAVPARPHELNRGTLLHARLRETLNTQSTAEGAVFTAELLADVGHNGEIMLPVGSLIRGHVSSIHGGKRISGGASMHLRPETVSLPDGTLYRLDAQITDLDSTQDLRVNDEGTIVLRSNPKAAAGVIGGVTGAAAVTGAMLGGGVGAAVGAAAGAGIATVVYLKREVQEVLPTGTNVIFALDQPLIVSPR